MRFYFKLLLPYFFMLVVNYYIVKYAFLGMTAPHDWSFAAGLLSLMVLVIADFEFILSRVKKTKTAIKKEKQNHEDVPSV